MNIIYRLELEADMNSGYEFKTDNSGWSHAAPTIDKLVEFCAHILSKNIEFAPVIPVKIHMDRYEIVNDENLFQWNGMVTVEGEGLDVLKKLCEIEYSPESYEQLFNEIKRLVEPVDNFSLCLYNDTFYDKNHNPCEQQYIEF